MNEPAAKPLFVPLKSQYFRAFESGAKSVEYRRAGPRWNETSCAVGRAVVLSHGYSGARIAARVVRTERVLGSILPNCDPYEPTDELLAIQLEILGPISR